MFQTIKALLIMLGLGGCTSLAPIGSVGPDNALALEPGDKITVQLTSGYAEEVEVVRFEPDALVVNGVVTDGLSIPYSDIRNVSVRRIDPGKSAIAVIGVSTGGFILTNPGAALVGVAAAAADCHGCLE